MKSIIHSLLWTESRSKAGKKRWSKSYQKKVKNFRFLTVPNLFWYPFWSSMDVISWPWWFEVKDNPTCRGLWLPAKCGIGHGVFGVKVPLMTRHDTTRVFSKWKMLDDLKRWKAVCQWQHGWGWLNRWNSMIQVICSHEDQKDPVLRLDFNGQFLNFFLDSSWYVSSYFHHNGFMYFMYLSS